MSAFPTILATATLIALKCGVWLAAIALLSTLARRGSAALRHALWSAGMIGVLLLPLVAWLPWTPRIEPATLPASWSQAFHAVSPLPASMSETPETPPGYLDDATEPESSQPAGPSPTPHGPDRRTAMLAVAANMASMVVLFLWFAGALALLVRAARRIHAANRLVARATPHGHGQRLADHLLREQKTRRRIRVLEQADATIPMTWGWLRPVVLLPPEARGWNRERLSAVLLHEIAHIERADAAVLTLAVIAHALHWFNPLAHHALRHIEETQELACDDRVLSRGVDTHDYAGHILVLARTLSLSARPVPALGAPSSRRFLEGRLNAMLDPRRSRSPVGLGQALLIAAVTLVLTGLLAGLGISIADNQGFALANVYGQLALDGQNHDLVGDRTWTMTHHDDDLKLSVRMRGNVVFRDDDSGIESMTDGSMFEVKHDDGKDACEIRFDAKRGQIERRFTLNGDRREWGPEADAWLAKVLPMVFRHSGFGADRRVARFLRESGVDGVLAEISLIHSDHAARIYYTELLRQADLDAKQLRAVLKQVGSDISSDFEMAELLVDAGKQERLDEAGRTLIVQATGTIESDYEKRRVLSSLIERHPMSAETYDAILTTARDIQSDYELAELLLGVANEHPIREKLVDPYLAAAVTIESDYELARVLSHLIEGPRDLDAATLERVIDASGSISSDHELAEFLLGVASHYRLRGPVRDAYRRAARSISSDYEARRVLAAIVEEGGDS